MPESLKKISLNTWDISARGFVNSRINFIFELRSPLDNIAIHNLKCLIMKLEVESQWICKAFLLWQNSKF